MIMHLQIKIKKLMPILVSVIILFFGVACEKKSEQLTKPKIVGQKIQMDSTDIEKPVSPKNDISMEINSVQKADQELITMQEHNDEAIILKEVVSTENDLLLEIETTGLLALYNPENKIDPFMPLFKEGPKEKVEVPQKVEREKRIPRTPLERIDLSQLKLVGIIQSSNGNKGLVEEASGKGYIISIGTYMGTNGGKVIEISKDRVIAEEEVDDVLGKLTLQKRELKLQKPFGEN
jgi:type IV pilus assembly protein PilP